MALLQPGDLFPKGTASIEFTSGSGTTITPFSQSGNAYVVFETDLISNPNEPTQSLLGATFTSLTASTGAVVDGAGYHAAIVTSPGSSFTFTPSVDIPAGRVLLRATGNIGLDVASFTGLLDTFTATSGYSVRQLRADATSSLRVRRSSDDAEQDIGFNTSNELDTTALLAFVGTGGTDNGFVTIWYDQSGNDKHATNSTAAEQPKIVDSGALVTVNSKAGIDFDGSDDFLNGVAKTTIDNTAIFCVIKSDSNTQDSVFIQNAVNGGNLVSLGLGGGGTNSKLGSRLKVASSNIDSAGDSTFTDTTQILVSYFADNSTSQIFIDGTEETANVTAKSSGANTTIGAKGDGNNPFNGKIQEVILYDSDESGKRTDIEANINTHFSIF